jgi:hypothetical protein
VTVERPPFPEVLDNSALSAFRSCPRKFQLEYLEHWKPKTPNVHLHAGGAFARGLEVAREAFYVEGLSPERAVARGLGALLEFYGMFEVPEDSVKGPERMCGALVYYFDTWKLEEDNAIPSTFPSGKRGIEFSFLEPLSVSHPTTGNPLLYSGRFDMVVDYAGGRFGEDDKTASQLGATWPRQWEMRAQFSGYCWGARQSGYPIDGMLVRGVSILKRGYDHAQTVTYRAPWMIERWEEQTYRDIKRMIGMWEEGFFDYNLDEACNAFGGCVFKQVCLSPDPTPWLETGFERRKWDPVSRKETLL